MNHPTEIAHIIPPYLLQRLAEGTEPIATQARATLDADTAKRRARARRTAPTVISTAAPTAAGPSREIFDAHGSEDLPGTVVRTEAGPATGDPAADEAYDGFGATWTLFKDVYGRNSIDGAGMALLGTVHYGEGYQNAFWNGERMVFGDGDGVIFGRFTASLDVIGHELTHGVTEHTAALAYRGQSGALNESLSDVFGVLVAQYRAGQTAAEADWLVGADLLLPGVRGVALRNLLHPGTAYDDPRLGKDPQPADMSGFVHTSSDNGGVHYNSGIPNRAFALVATTLGGPAWERAGQIWYDVLTGPDIQPGCDFATFAALTIDAALARFGEGAEVAAVRAAWATVQVDETTPKIRSTGTGIDPDAQLLVRRSGGVAGISRERRTRLAELPRSDRRAWAGLLTERTLPKLAEASDPTPDAFCYGVVCRDVELDVEVAEHDLPAHLRALFERTLSG